MNFLSNPIVARLLWVFPVALLIGSGLVAKAGLEQREVANVGIPIEAQILDVEMNERAEIAQGVVRLRYVPPGETTPVERSVEMQLTVLKSIEARNYQTVQIRMLPNSEQIVLEPYKRGQWIWTFSSAAMALIGALGLAVMVRGWNRFLREHGDPAEAYG